jgi:hypothetical protein
MKKVVLILAIVALVCGGIFAQTATTAVSSATAVQVSGNLGLVNGRVALTDGGKTYYLEGIQHLTGLVDGLNEGASVKVEGYASPSNVSPEYVFLRLTKLTFNGKSYDIPQHQHKDKKVKTDKR